MESVYINTVTMIAIFFVLLGLFTPNVAKKESVRYGSLNHNSGVLLDLIKRIRGSDYNPYPSVDPEEAARTGDSDGQDRQQTTCEPVIQSGSIIKATQSIAAGAVYIDSLKGVHSNAECIEYCCRNATCDIAVYQDKDDRYCYLFNCNNKCQFKDHSGYFVSSISHKRASEKPEEDLQNLNGEDSSDEDRTMDNQNAASDSDENVQGNKAPLPGETTPRVVAPSPTEAQEPFIAPHSVGLRGYCTQDRHCEDPNASCLENNCMCQDTYYNKEGLCRKVCPPSNFECFELGTLSRGPECVPRTQVCDSYMQCADGSDEFNCENVDFPSGMRHQQKPSASTINKDQGQVPSHSSSGHDSSDIDKADTHAHKTQDIKTTQAPSKSSKTTVAEVKPNSGATSASKNHSSATTAKPPSEEHGGRKHVFMSSEKVIIASTTSDAEGPIIALSLGLVFTIILLVLVGCRLRNVRHRLRKGRPLHQNEADYLINGMYL